MVVASFLVSRIRRSAANTGCAVFSKSHVRASASVVYPVLIFLVFGKPSSSKRTTCSCLGDATLNSWPAALWATAVSRETSSSKNLSRSSSAFRFTATPRFSISVRSAAMGSSSSSKRWERFLLESSAISESRSAKSAQADVKSARSESDSSMAAPFPNRSTTSLISCALTPGLMR